MTDAEIKERLLIKVDLLGLSLERDRVARWVISQITSEVQKLIKEESKKAHDVAKKTSPQLHQ